MSWTEVNLNKPRSPTPTANIEPSTANSDSMSESELREKYPDVRRSNGSTTGPPPLTAVTNDEIDEVLDEFRQRIFDATAETPESLSINVSERCKALFELDNRVVTMPNIKGEISEHYPSQIHIPVMQRHTLPSQAHYETYNTQPIHDGQLRKLWQNSRRARCRTRVPVPVILWRNKFLVRSATISGGAEVAGRVSTETVSSVFFGQPPEVVEEDRRAMASRLDATRQLIEAGRTEDGVANAQAVNLETDQTAPFLEAARLSDIQLLNYLRVGTITDLMVEKKKKKFGIKVTSSEKIDKMDRYADFLLSVMPYPGCEFFKKFRDAAHSTDNLVYSWSEEQNDAPLRVADIQQHWSFYGRRKNDINNPPPWYKRPMFPNPQPYAPLPINWQEYKSWDLRKLTLNYLRKCLHNLTHSDYGMLVHCISGWDRTPLFVSLLRISLWADGEIHQSLSPLQMMYLTIGYDWYLFGHDLPTRLAAGQDIFFFCFHMLKYMGIKELMVDQPRWKPRIKRTSNSSTGSESAGGNGGNGIGAAEVDMILEGDEVDSAQRLSQSRNGNAPKESKRVRSISGCQSISEQADEHDKNKLDGSMEDMFEEMERMGGGSYEVSENGTARKVDDDTSDKVDDEMERKADEETIPKADDDLFIDTQQPPRSAPMAMPTRKRTDSTSSTSSWTVVTNTGSLKQGEPFTSPSKGEEDELLMKRLEARRKKLDELREQFYLRYWSKIGQSKQHGAFGAFLNTFACKVGLSSKML